MGTKRHIAHRVRRLAEGVKPQGTAVDLFSGMGCVTESMAGYLPVTTNDALEFTSVLARARFMGENRTLKPADAVEKIRPLYREHVDTLLKKHRARLAAEESGLEKDRAALVAYMAEAEHVANSPAVAKKAAKAAKATGAERYCMTTLYFSAGYFGLRQAIQLDSLRFAIDTLDLPDDRDWLLAAWLSAAATVTNAPGHTAQYLKPNTDAAHKRIRRYWRRNVWEEFRDRLIEIKQVGPVAWRRENTSEVSDALDLLRSGRLARTGLVYADPPYTKDQYSRYYHVYETLLRYDFPGAAGEGRTPPEHVRATSAFSTKRKVVQAFTDLFDAVADLKAPLILSYPSTGLLVDAGGTVADLAAARLKIETIESFGAEHSTLGASKGTKTKRATENLYVCRPA